MKPTALVLIATLMALALSLAVSAQEKKDAAEMSVTGCFNIGDAEGYYVITDEKTGKKITVIGDAGMLASHAKPGSRPGHKVTITGSMTTEKDKDVLKASEIQMWWTSLAWPCASKGTQFGAWAIRALLVGVILAGGWAVIRRKAKPGP